LGCWNVVSDAVFTIVVRRVHHDRFALGEGLSI
jgi:hypothetical protein